MLLVTIKLIWSHKKNLSLKKKKKYMKLQTGYLKFINVINFLFVHKNQIVLYSVQKVLENYFKNSVKKT